MLPVRCALALLLLAPFSSPPNVDPPKTVRFRRLHEIVRDIHASAAEEGASVLWVVDTAEETRRFGQFEEIGDVVAALPAGKKPVHLGIATLGKSLSQALEFTDDSKAFATGMRRLQSRDTASADVNVPGNVADAVPLLESRPGRRILVLFSQRWLEVENGLDRTAAALAKAKITFVSIAPEALYSNPWWRLNAPPAKLECQGADSPYVEFPSQWIFSDVEPLYTVPSAFAHYGLRRLAAATGGTNYLYYVPGDFSGYCELSDCVRCARAHARCASQVDEGKLPLVAPFDGSRDEFRKHAAADPLWPRIFLVWEAAVDAGLVRGLPPLDAKAGLRESKRKLPQKAFLQFIADWDSERGAARAMAAEVDRLLVPLAKDIKDRGPKAHPRALATAEALSIFLRAARFNLRQLALFCDEMSGLGRRKNPKPQFGGEIFDTYAARAAEFTGWTYDCHPLCHLLGSGGEPWPGTVSFLGGAKVEGKELAEIVDAARKAIAKHDGTPWALLVRHANLATFLPTVGGTPVFVNDPRVRIPGLERLAQSIRMPRLPGHFPATPTTGGGGSQGYGSNYPGGVPDPGSGGWTPSGNPR